MEENKESADMSIQDASEYWDEHDFGEFEDVHEEKETRFVLNKKKYVGIDFDLYDVIRSAAKKFNKSEDSLINEWLSEKVNVLK